MQDATGGIALYLDDPAVAAWPAGTQVQASGVVASRYGQRTIRLAEADLRPRRVVRVARAPGRFDRRGR